MRRLRAIQCSNEYLSCVFCVVRVTLNFYNHRQRTLSVVRKKSSLMRGATFAAEFAEQVWKQFTYVIQV